MRRHVLVSGILAILLSLPLGVAATAVAPGCAGAGPNHAALVVTHADGSSVTKCVAFDTPSISGEQLLKTSGIDWSGQSFSFGEAVCAIDREPASYTECLSKDNYWATFTSTAGGAWTMAMVGISDIQIHDGDAEGFRYVPTTGTPPDPGSPKGVCDPAAAATSGAGTSAPTSGSASSGPEPGAIVAVFVVLGLVGLASITVIRRRRAPRAS